MGINNKNIIILNFKFKEFKYNKNFNKVKWKLEKRAPSNSSEPKKQAYSHKSWNRRKRTSFL